MSAAGTLRYVETLPRGDAQALRPRGTLVLMHAFPLNARMWEGQRSLSDHGWRVLAPHLRGFDGDTREPGRSVDDYAGDVIDLLDSLHIHEAVIGGLSLGGYVTLAIFRHAPRYFQGMILADTRAGADTPEAVANRQKMLTLVRDQGPAAVADEMVPKLLGETTKREAPELSQRVRDLVLASSAEAIAGAVTAMMTRPDSTPLLASIHCPTLIVVGGEDTLTPPPLSEEMHRAIGGSELVTIPGAGHVSNLEQPEAFNAALSRFLTHRV